MTCRLIAFCCALSVPVVFLPACFSGGGSAGNGLSTTGDRLLLGTTAGDNESSGIITMIVHDDAEPASPATVEAKITTTGSATNSITCMGVPAPPMGATCSDVDAIVCGSVCCPSDKPFICAASALCYATAEASAEGCGDACESCSGVDTVVTTSGQPMEQILTGSVDDQGNINLDGGGYSLTGTLTGEGSTGEYTDPNGAGAAFSAVDATNDEVTRFCGTFTGGDSGAWNLQSSSTAVSGSFAGGLASGTLEGELSGKSVSLSFSGLFASGTAQGSIQGDTVTGTWTTNDAAYTGNWSGGADDCIIGTGSATKTASDCCEKTAQGFSCSIEGC